MGKNEGNSNCLGRTDHNGNYECGYGVKFSCEDCRFGPLSLIDKRRGYDPRAKKHLKE